MARREEKVDAELLARLESGGGDKIRVPLPNRKVNEMFAIADQILGGRRVRAVCEDGDIAPWKTPPLALVILVNSTYVLSSPVR